MQVVLNVSDENVSEVAAALGYRPNPLDLSYPSAETFIQMTVTDGVRQSVANYRARVAANAEMAKVIQL